MQESRSAETTYKSEQVSQVLEAEDAPILQLVISVSQMVFPLKGMNPEEHLEHLS